MFRYTHQLFEIWSSSIASVSLFSCHPSVCTAVLLHVSVGPHALSHLHRLPSALLEQPEGEQSHRGFRDENCPKYTREPESQHLCEHIGKRDLNEPKEDEIDLGRRGRIACPIERLYRHHPPGVYKIRIGNNLQPHSTDRNDTGSV